MANTHENKSKSKLLKIEINSGSDSDDNEHELSYYMKDKVKLMKEVLKLIKPKKIKSMAPDCIKHLDIVEINSMLLEELLGISNKRLRYIFNGENVDRETSSSDSDEDKKPIDIISLDDISDDDIEVTINPSDKGQNKRRKHKSHKIKKEPTSSEKKRKFNKDKSESSDNLKESERQKLMSVLELLELQARARAIKSQLALEANKKPIEEIVLKNEDDSDPDAVIIESPQHKEIVLSSSDSEDASSLKDRNETCIETTGQCKTISPTDGADQDVIVLDDDNEAENSKVDNKTLDLKKQKLLSKVKKIKLIRHKSLNQGNVINKDGSNSERGTNKDGRDSEVKSDNAEPEIGCKGNDSSECSLIKETNTTDDQELLITTNLVTTKSSNLGNELESCAAPQPEKLSDCNKDIGKQNDFACNEIDNDEIVVINLDEDEMKGIENV